MKRYSSFVIAVALGISVVAFAASCKREVAASAEAAIANAPAKQAVATPEVAKIVFIGKKNACDCTRTRVDESLAAMQKALDGRSDVAVEQLQVDVNEAAVSRYQELRPIMVLPAIYLLAASGTLVDMLQGELTVEQVQKALGG